MTVDGSTVPMLARSATREERADMWPPRVVKAYKGYEGYQRNTPPREIPLLILERRRAFR